MLIRHFFFSKIFSLSENKQLPYITTSFIVEKPIDLIPRHYRLKQSNLTCFNTQKKLSNLIYSKSSFFFHHHYWPFQAKKKMSWKLKLLITRIIWVTSSSYQRSQILYSVINQTKQRVISMKQSPISEVSFYDNINFNTSSIAFLPRLDVFVWETYQTY